MVMVVVVTRLVSHRTSNIAEKLFSALRREEQNLWETFLASLAGFSRGAQRKRLVSSLVS